MATPFWKDVTVRTVAGVLVACIMIVLAWLWGFWQTLFEFLTSTWSLPVWIVIVAPLVLIFATGYTLNRLARRETVTELTYEDYQQDEFFGVLWRWRYIMGKINVQLSAAFCVKCGFRMTSRYDYQSDHFLFRCSNCQHYSQVKVGPTFEPEATLRDNLALQIEHRINTGAWKEAFKDNRTAVKTST